MREYKRVSVAFGAFAGAQRTLAEVRASDLRRWLLDRPLKPASVVAYVRALRAFRADGEVQPPHLAADRCCSPSLRVLPDEAEVGAPIALVDLIVIVEPSRSHQRSRQIICVERAVRTGWVVGIDHGVSIGHRGESPMNRVISRR